MGMSMQEIGRAAAIAWGLPPQLVGAMRKVEPRAGGDALEHDEWLAALSTMSALCADALWHDDAAGGVAVRALARSFSGMLGVAPDVIMAAVETAREVAAAGLSIAPLARPAARRARALAETRLRAEGNVLLRAGLAEMNKARAHATPGQLMSIALGALHRGLSFSRAIAFMRNRRSGQYQARLGLGDGVAACLAQLAFDDAYEPNVFHASLHSDRAIFIDNPHEPRFAAKLPAWWRASLAAARSFVILPVSVNGEPAGFLYGDWDDSYPMIALSEVEFALMNELRALAAGIIAERRNAAISAA